MLMNPIIMLSGCLSFVTDHQVLSISLHFVFSCVVLKFVFVGCLWA